MRESLGAGFAKYDDETDQSNLPGSFALSQNYPNPFNPETQIAYVLPEGSDVNIEIYDLLGQRVKTLVDGYQSAGNHTVIWNGCDDYGKTVSSGIYFYKMKAGDFVETKKMSLMR